MGGALVVMALTACNGNGDDPGREPSSQFGFAAFRWECAGDGDLACSVGSAFPRRAAVGSSFEIRASATNDTPDETSVSRVVPAATLHTGTRSGDGLVALEEGEVWLMALGPDGELVDLAKVEQVPVASLDLVDAEALVFPPSCEPGSTCSEAVWEEDPEPLQFVAGRRTRVRAEPFDDTGQRLMGDLDYEWEVTPPSVATLGSDSTGNEVELVVHRAGQFQIQVSAGGITRAFVFGSISDGPTRRRPEMDGSGTDTGTDTDTDGMGTESDTEGTTTGTGGGTETDGASSTGGGM